ncbi:MAG: hypothetical protein H7Y86_02395 [Rhizobacter sp.]|nr:hypothetical protein [Ferruginibacter sp.]
MKAIKSLMMAVLTIITVAVFAQPDTSGKHAHNHTPGKASTYTCPMHPQIAMDKPGKCSICGMDLVKSKKKAMKMYACPMHPAVTSKKPGKCTECGMDMKLTEMAYCCAKHPDIASNKPGKCPACGNLLNLSPKEKMKMEVMKTYACPMHSDEASNKPGKCSKCGMDLTKHE